MSFDDDDFYDGMFDFDGDGETDIFEEALAYEMMYGDLDDPPANDYGTDDDDDPDDYFYGGAFDLSDYAGMMPDDLAGEVPDEVIDELNDSFPEGIPDDFDGDPGSYSEERDDGDLYGYAAGADENSSDGSRRDDRFTELISPVPSADTSSSTDSPSPPSPPVPPAGSSQGNYKNAILPPDENDYLESMRARRRLIVSDAVIISLVFIIGIAGLFGLMLISFFLMLLGLLFYMWPMYLLLQSHISKLVQIDAHNKVINEYLASLPPEEAERIRSKTLNPIQVAVIILGVISAALILGFSIKSAVKSSQIKKTYAEAWEMIDAGDYSGAKKFLMWLDPEDYEDKYSLMALCDSYIAYHKGDIDSAEWHLGHKYFYDQPDKRREQITAYSERLDNWYQTMPYDEKQSTDNTETATTAETTTRRYEYITTTAPYSRSRYRTYTTEYDEYNVKDFDNEEDFYDYYYDDFDGYDDAADYYFDHGGE